METPDKHSTQNQLMENGNTAQTTTGQVNLQKEEIDILLKEYEQLLLEIRNIHDKRITFFKMLTTSIIALLGYILSGLVLYINSRGDKPSPIPQALAYGYTSLGIIITCAVYAFVHNTFYYIGPSKKHTIRAWRAIHCIRSTFKNLSPHLMQALMMPDIRNNPDRPRLSRRWELGALLFPTYHLLFFFILTLLITSFFAPIDSQLGLLFPQSSLDIFEKAIIIIWPFLVLRLVLGGKPMRDYVANIREARLISTTDIFPTQRNVKPVITPSWLWWVNALIVLSSFFLWGNAIWWNLIPNLCWEQRLTLVLTASTILLSILTEFIYLYFSGILGLRITKGKNIFKIEFERD